MEDTDTPIPQHSKAQRIGRRQSISLLVVCILGLSLILLTGFEVGVANIFEAELHRERLPPKHGQAAGSFQSISEPQKAPEPAHQKDFQEAPQPAQKSAQEVPGPPHQNSQKVHELAPQESSQNAPEPSQLNPQIVPEPPNESSQTITKPDSGEDARKVPEPFKQSSENAPETPQQRAKKVPGPSEQTAQMVHEPASQESSQNSPEPSQQRSQIVPESPHKSSQPVHKPASREDAKKAPEQPSKTSSENVPEPQNVPEPSQHSAQKVPGPSHQNSKMVALEPSQQNPQIVQEPPHESSQTVPKPASGEDSKKAPEPSKQSSENAREPQNVPEPSEKSPKNVQEPTQESTQKVSPGVVVEASQESSPTVPEPAPRDSSKNMSEPTTTEGSKKVPGGRSQTAPEPSQQNSKREQELTPLNSQNVTGSSPESSEKVLKPPPRGVCIEASHKRRLRTRTPRFRRRLANSSATNLPPYRRWNFKTQSIDPPKVPSNNTQLSSLEILQDVLLDLDPRTPLSDTRKCFIPNVDATRKLAQQVKQKKIPPFPLPIINVGMPKSGSSTAHAYFKCIGRHSSHGQQGNVMLEHVDQHKSPIPDNRQADAHMQMDNNFGECAFPQVQLLDELHQQYPNATFLFLFRPVQDWIGSVHRWNTMSERWSRCRIPGLQCTGQRYYKQKTRDCCTDANLQNWWCNHVRHVRQFVKLHPSHKLIELDLYDESGTAELLSDLFQANPACWGHKNANPPHT